MKKLVLCVDKDIPGLAPAGATIIVRASDERHPVSVATEHGPEALDILADHPGHWSLADSPTPGAVALLRAKLDGPKPTGPVRVLRLMPGRSEPVEA